MPVQVINVNIDVSEYDLVFNKKYLMYWSLISASLSSDVRNFIGGKRNSNRGSVRFSSAYFDVWRLESYQVDKNSSCAVSEKFSDILHGYSTFDQISFHNIVTGS